MVEQHLKGGVGGGEAEDAGEGGQAAERSSFSAAGKGFFMGIVFFSDGVFGQIVDRLNRIDAGKIDGDIALAETFSYLPRKGAVFDIF